MDNFTELNPVLPLGSSFHTDRDFKIIVLTGGPGSGKSSAMKRVKGWLEPLGYTVYTQAEIATEIIAGVGLFIDDKLSLPNGVFQRFKVGYSLAKENCFVGAIKHSVAPKKVYILDRGVMEDEVYAGPEMFADILDELGLSRMDVRDRRYDAVFHLQTAGAIGDNFFSTENNIARTEDAELARIRDYKTIEAWVGHRHWRMIPAMVDKEQRFDLLRRHILAALGEPEPVEIERKFLVKYTDPKLLTVPYSTFEVEQSYLKRDSSGISPRIRSMMQGSSAMYFETRKVFKSAMESTENEKEINLHGYLSMGLNKNPKVSTIAKHRTYFVYKDQYFELDLFDHPYNDLALMEIELLDKSDPVNLPPFIEVVREVTDDLRYKNSNLGRLSLGQPGNWKD